MPGFQHALGAFRLRDIDFRLHQPLILTRFDTPFDATGVSFRSRRVSFRRFAARRRRWFTPVFRMPPPRSFSPPPQPVPSFFLLLSLRFRIGCQAEGFQLAGSCPAEACRKPSRGGETSFRQAHIFHRMLAFFMDFSFFCLSLLAISVSSPALRHFRRVSILSIFSISRR